MFRFALPLLTALTIAAPLSAQPMTPGHDAARAMGESVFQALDLDRSGTVSADEMRIFGARAFEAMDVDASLGVSRSEMISWEYGLSEMAAYRGRSQAHTAAIGLIFDLFDADGTADLTQAEHLDGLLFARDVADRDRDGLLSTKEFRDGFIFSVAMRNAMDDPS